MKSRVVVCLFVAVLNAVAVAQVSGPAPASTAGAGTRATAPALAAEYGKLPLSFEANEGQSDPQVKFVSRGGGYSLFLTDRAAVLALSKGAGDGGLERPGALKRKRAATAGPVTTDVVRMELVGAAGGARVAGEDELAGKSNYFIGSDPGKWHSNVATYSKVKYTGIYPGVDLVYYGSQRQLEYDFIVAAEADARPIRLHFGGVERLRVDGNGNLEVSAKDGEIAFHKPVVYQERGGRREAVDGAFKLLAGNEVGFALGSYDRGRALVIDPTLAYSTFLGGSGREYGIGVAVDSTGAVYVTGNTSSTDFPVSSGGFQKTYPAATLSNFYGVSFVAKLTADGSGLVYASYLAPDDGEGSYSQGIAVDSSRNVYICGATSSNSFPTTVGAYQPVNRGFTGGFNSSNAYVAKLDPSGSKLLYSTYLGGSGKVYTNQSFAGYTSGDSAYSIAADGSGNAYVTGSAGSADFPIVAGAYQSINKAFPSNTSNVFVTKLNASGTGLVYSTYVGGTGVAVPGSGGFEYSYGDQANGIAVDGGGDAFLVGQTYSTDFPVTAGAFQTKNSGTAKHADNAFVAKLNPSGSGLLYSTYLGGSGFQEATPYASTSYGDEGRAIGIDANGNAYVGGDTRSVDFPVTAGSFESVSPATANNSQTGFVAKLNASGSALLYSTYLGGSVLGPGLSDGVQALAVDGAGSAYVTGYTYSSNFPVTPDAFQATNNAAGDGGPAGFLTIFDTVGHSLSYSTLLGGSGQSYILDFYGFIGSYDPGDVGASIALDGSGGIYVMGTSSSTDFPTTIGAYQVRNKTLAGLTSFLTKFHPGAAAALTTSAMITLTSSQTAAYEQGGQVVITALVQPVSGSGTPTGTVKFSLDKNPAPVALPLDGTGHATYTVNLTAGDYIVGATYSGDSKFPASDTSLYQGIAPGNLTIKLVSGSGQSSPVGTPYSEPLVVSLTNQGSPVANASVTFVGGASKVGTGTTAEVLTDANGMATVTATPLEAGSGAILVKVAYYYANPQYFALTGTALAAATPTFSPGAGSYGSTQNVTIRDSTSGTVIYYTTDGSTPTTGSTKYTGPVAVKNTETINAIAVVDGYSLSAVGSATYSEPLGALIATTTTLTSSVNPAVVGTVVTATAFVQAASGGGVPTGTIAGVLDGVPLGSLPLDGTGHVSFSTSQLSIGQHVLKATYSGDTHYSGSSAMLSETITSAGLQFVTIAPCRMVDTRGAAGAFGGPLLGAGTSREFDVPQGGCGIPSSAVAYSLNATVVPLGPLAYLTLWPTGEAQPNVSTLNSLDGRIKANAAIVPAGTNGGVSMFVSDATHAILDINGYFVQQGASGGTGLAFYPAAPCRVVDTRGTAGALGGPFIAGGSSRSFNLEAGSCGISYNASAYSLNVTAIPHNKLSYLTMWPTGDSQPNVSTLNALTGAITANAAIVPAASGTVSIFMSDDADVVVDVNGYFAPPGPGGVLLYTATPCRVVDTRSSSGLVKGVLAVGVEASGCAASTGAQAYVLNATVVPPGPLDYLTLWPDGQTQPVVSTLNALDGAITSNMAIVPAANGKVDVFASNPTQVIMDLSGYFAP